MKKIDMISKEDWMKISARLETSCNALLDLYTMLANSLGRSHPVTKKALTAYRKTASLESDMRRLAREHSKSIFEAKELDRLFPDVDTGKQGNNLKGRYDYG